MAAIAFWGLLLTLVLAASGSFGCGLFLAVPMMGLWMLFGSLAHAWYPADPPPPAVTPDTWTATIVADGKAQVVRVTAPTEELALAEIVRHYRTTAIRSLTRG
jgi:hypothetical protein